MDFEKETINDVVIEKINLSRATYKEAGEFRKIIESDISGGCDKFIISLKLCEYIDSTFLGVFINTLKQIKKNGGDLKLASACDDIQVFLDITKITQFIQIYPDTESALISFNKNQ